MEASSCSVEVSDLAQRELAEVLAPEDLAAEIAEAQAFLSRRFVPAGKVSKVTTGTPPIWEYRATARPGELRLFYWQDGATRIVELAYLKKRDKIPPRILATAQARASERLARKAG